MIELNYATTVEILDGLVEEFGSDHVYVKGAYGKCDYVRDGKPSCIVGHVLAKVGVPIERLEAADKYVFGGGVSARSLLRDLKEDGVLQCDESVRALLSEAQSAQDSLTPWGDSVRLAKHYSQF
jgi:hypothetical protein